MGRKTQVGFWLSMADSIHISTPSQNSNEMIGSGVGVEIHKENRREDNRFLNVNMFEGEQRY